MGINESLGQQFRNQINAGLKKLGAVVDNINPSKGMNLATVENPITQLKSLAGLSLDYKNSIMMRGLGFARIQPIYWKQLFPYRFILLESNGSTYKPVNGYAVTLPITPQDIQITSQFASSVSITSRGVLEEHNGLNVKSITFTATTGVLVSRPSFNLADKVDGNIGAIFGGTIQAVQTFANAVANVFPRQQAQLPDVTDSALEFSGYYQYHIIRAFLEMYAELKKSPNGRGYRLGLEVGKDRAIYLVTPQAFVTKVSAASPMEKIFTFQGTAWATITDNFAAEKQLPLFMGNDISDVQKILNGIRNARTVMQSAKDIISAVKTDAETNIFGPINNIILTLKEAASVVQTVADFPSDLAKSFQSTIVKNFDGFKTALPESVQAQFSAAVQPSLAESSDTGSVSGVVATKPEILNNITFTDAVPISSLSLTPEQQQSVQDAIDSAADNTSNASLRDLIDDLEELSAALENQALTQGVDSPAWDILYATHDTVQNIYSLIADNFYETVSVSEQESGVNALLDFYQGYAASGGIAFQKPQSKFAIPFPYRTSLEWLAQQYLGDAERWIEIAAVNNLQSPYIDEDGFQRVFLTNGTGRQFNVNSAENMFVDQSIWLSSNTRPLQRRTIKAIQKVTDSNFIITVDGEDDLENFTIADAAKMKAYLPNTVNSQKLIYIPIDVPSNLDNTTVTPITFLNETPEMLALAKIDWLLDQNGDLAVTQDGFQNLSYGKQNIIQAARLKMITIAGGVILHPEYGAGVEVGESEADFSIDDLMARIKDSFSEDPRFQSVDAIEIEQQPGVVKMRVQLTAADNQGAVSVDFNIKQ